MFKIEVDNEKCIGCAACTAQCDNLIMEGDKAKPVKAEVNEVGCNKEAADLCPVQAIIIKEVK